MHSLALKQGQQSHSKTWVDTQIIGYIARNPAAGEGEAVLKEIIRGNIQG